MNQRKFSCLPFAKILKNITFLGRSRNHLNLSHYSICIQDILAFYSKYHVNKRPGAIQEFLLFFPFSISLALSSPSLRGATLVLSGRLQLFSFLQSFTLSERINNSSYSLHYKISGYVTFKHVV